MNQIGEAGFNVVAIYNGKNSPRQDYRLSVVTFKADKTKSSKLLNEVDINGDFTGKKVENPDFDPLYKKPDARCVDVPAFKIQASPQILQDALQQAFEDLQDQVIRRLIVEAIEEGKNAISIHDDQVNCEAIAAFAAATAAGGKITKDGIEDWFDTEMANELTLAVANAMKLPDTPDAAQNKRLADMVTNYKGVFMTLAAPRAGMSKTIANQCKKALELCENKDSRMFKALDAKVRAQLEEKEPQLLGL